MNEDQLHELARLFMDQFCFEDKYSLDEFLIEYAFVITDEERSLGYYILELFDKI